MENKKHLEEINQESLQKLEEYIKKSSASTEEHHQKMDAAKAKWQAAWNEFLETLLVLERIEI